MPLLDVTSILNDPDFADGFSAKRREQTVDTHGRLVTVERLIPDLVGVVTMTSPTDLDRGPDYQVNSRSITIVCKFPLRGESTNYQPDIVLWRGDNYLVRHVDLYPQFGAGFYQVQCESIEKTDSPLEPGSSVVRLDFSIGGNPAIILG
jgi:hypothetical protein